MRARSPFALIAFIVVGQACSGAIEGAAGTPIGASEPNATADASGGSALSTRCKRGMAVGGAVTPALTAADLAAVAPGVSWWYNWGTTPPSDATRAASANLAVSFVPMVFTLPVNEAQVALQLSAIDGALLTFNEPNFMAQGNVTPLQAAQAWPAIERLAAAQNLKIVSPALNYCGGGCNQADPFVWLDQFFAACTGCQVDYIAIHAYVCDANALKSAYLTPFYTRYQKPLWLTEMACLDGSADASQLSVQQKYMTAAVAMLEADPNVARYAWFIARTQTASPPLGLLGASGQLSELGKLYVSLPQACRP